MWKILNKITITTKLLNLKKSKGTTIVEVLVAVIIIGVVSVYGLSFFSSSYKYEVDSKDYDIVLQNLVRQIEMIKGSEYKINPGGNPYTAGVNSDLRDDRNCRYYAYPEGITDSESETVPTSYTKFNFLTEGHEKRIRRDCIVRYYCRLYTNGEQSSSISRKFPGSTKVVCEATWPWKEGYHYSKVEEARKNKITLVTYVAKKWEPGEPGTTN